MYRLPCMAAKVWIRASKQAVLLTAACPLQLTASQLSQGDGTLQPLQSLLQDSSAALTLPYTLHTVCLLILLQFCLSPCLMRPSCPSQGFVPCVLLALQLLPMGFKVTKLDDMKTAVRLPQSAATEPPLASNVGVLCLPVLTL